MKYLLKLGKASLHRYPVGQKFCQICSIWHGFQDTRIFVFCNFYEKFENSKWPPVLASEISVETWKLVFTDTLWVKHFSKIPLVNFYFMKKMVSKSTHRSHISVLFYMCTLWAYISNFVFCIFCQNSKIEYDPHFWGGEIFFAKMERVIWCNTLWVETFDEIALSHTVKEIQAVLCFTR